MEPEGLFAGNRCGRMGGEEKLGLLTDFVWRHLPSRV